jgi:hypothetical protein
MEEDIGLGEMKFKSLLSRNGNGRCVGHLVWSLLLQGHISVLTRLERSSTALFLGLPCTSYCMVGSLSRPEWGGGMRAVRRD